MAYMTAKLKSVLRELTLKSIDRIVEGSLIIFPVSLINTWFSFYVRLAISEMSDQISFLSDGRRWLGFLPWLVLNAQCQKLPDSAGFGSRKLEPCPLRQPTHMHQESCLFTYCKPETLCTEPLLEQTQTLQTSEGVLYSIQTVSAADFRLSALEAVQHFKSAN